MLAAILRLRASQIKRYAQSLGILRLLILLVLLAYALLLVQSVISSYQRGLAFFSIVFLLILQYHRSRNDALFLSNFHIHKKRYFTLEYFLLALIPSLLLIFTVSWPFAPLLLASTFFIYRFKAKKNKEKKSYNILKNLPVQALEWRLILRRHFYLAFTFYIMLYFAAIKIGGFCAGVLLSALLLASSNIYCEDALILQSFVNNGKKFIQHKIKNTIGIWLLSLVPSLFIFLIFNFEYWYIAILAIVVGIIVNLFALFYKYALYTPGDELMQLEMIIFLVLIGSLLPVFLPVIIVMLFKYYRGASRNLNYHFYA